MTRILLATFLLVSIQNKVWKKYSVDIFLAVLDIFLNHKLLGHLQPLKVGTSTYLNPASNELSRKHQCSSYAYVLRDLCGNTFPLPLLAFEDKIIMDMCSTN